MINCSPDNEDVYTNIADKLGKLLDQKRSIYIYGPALARVAELYKKMLQEKGPAGAVSYFNLGSMYDKIGDYKNASEMLEKYVKSGLNPTWNYGYLLLWLSYNKLGLWKKALKPLEVGLKRNPNNRRLMTSIIQQYLLLGNKKEAAKWFVKYERTSRIDVESMYYGYRTFGGFNRFFVFFNGLFARSLN